MDNFNDLGISEEILANLAKIGYEKPTEIQAQAIPVIREKQDVVFQSQTGSGKTAAFGIPLIEGVMQDVYAAQFLVLVPTRELAAQVSAEMTRLCQNMDVHIATVYGGASFKAQEEALKKAQIIVGTPGRILDHLKRRTMSFSIVRGFVLDEADKMLSMGFLPDVQLIFKHLPKRRQTILSSATFPPIIERVITQYLIEPVRISTSSDAVAARTVTHCYCMVSNEDKERALLDFIEKEQPTLSLIFCNTKAEVKSVHRFLDDADVSVAYLSSDLNQNQREKTLRRLKTGLVQHVVCTDVAARGIDIPHLSHVFLFSSGEDLEAYVHRTGRTGRAGRAGKAISIVSGQDVSNFNRALKVHKIEAEELERPTQEEILQSRLENDYQTLAEIDFAKDADVRDEFELLAKKLDDKQAKALLPFLLERFLRQEPTAVIEDPLPPPAREERSEHEDVPVHDDRGRKGGRGGDRGGRRKSGERNDRGERGGRGGDRGGERRPEFSARVVIALGREDGIGPRDIKSIITRQGKGRDKDIGNIDIHGHETVVNITPESVDNVLTADGKHFRGLELFVGKAE